jgi:type 1 glutamine amidotransferase
VRLVLRSTCFAVALALSAVLAQPASGQDKDLDKIKKVQEALPDKAPAKPKQPRRILIFSKTAGFRHDSIPIGIKAITMMGDKTGAYTAYATEDESYFEPEKLSKFDAVFMLNTTLDCFRPKELKKGEVSPREEMLKKSLVDFVAGGKGLIGVHSATDTYHNWKEYNQMMGGTFDGHPWHKLVPVKNLDPKHPLNAAFDGKDFEIADEIYQFRRDTAQPSERHFLLELDTTKLSDIGKGNRGDKGPYPIAWLSTYGKGRTFYCSLGHRQEIYWNPMILRHYLAGIQYALGDLDANAAPTAKAATAQ